MHRPKSAQVSVVAGQTTIIIMGLTFWPSRKLSLYRALHTSCSTVVKLYLDGGTLATWAVVTTVQG